jgi:phenylacetate-CoA ligase
MILSTWQDRRDYEAMDAEALADHQLRRLNRLLQTVLPANSFYRQRLAGVELPLASLDALADLPLTYKEELVTGPSQGDVAANHTWPQSKYVRFHQTSGTRGRPMVVLDTVDDWQWWIELWQYVLDAAQFVPEDRLLMAFSFGPFIGFWSAHAAAEARGCLVVPGGGMSSLARLELLRSSGATGMFCTPSYALHMAEVAREHAIDVAALPLRKMIVAGEPGGSVPATRRHIEEVFDLTVIDHAGASEVGPWGYGDASGTGLYVNEAEFIAEFISVDSGRPAGDDELSELVLTTLGRAGAPVIRYRTGDLVRPVRSGSAPNRFVMLAGGVLGRADDMMVVRGVNIFPSSIEQIVRSFPEIVEFRTIAMRSSEMDQLEIEIEDRLDRPERVAEELRLRLGLKISVRAVPLGSLPRFEGKGKRFVDLRS